jgi:uncharacterized protein YjiS (DUF1127 family)
MTTTTEVNPIRWTTTGRLRALVEAAAVLLATFRKAREARRSVAQLLHWNDHMLSDIGLTRDEVESALAARFTEDPSKPLKSFSDKRRFAEREFRMHAR